MIEFDWDEDKNKTNRKNIVFGLRKLDQFLMIFTADYF